jgi:hypothetical protein
MLPESWNAFRRAGRLALRDTYVRHLDAVVHRVADEVHERVGDLLDDRLVQLGVGARDLEIDLLAEFPAHVAHDAPEPVARLADLHHPHLQRAVADLLDEIGDHLRRFEQAWIASVPGEQVCARARDDEFADQRDEAVELVGLHADETALFGTLIPLAGDSHLQHLVGNRLLGDQQLPDGRCGAVGVLLRRERTGQFVLRHGAAGDQHLADPFAVGGRALQHADPAFDLGVGGGDAKFAVVLHEVEHCGEVGLRALSFEQDVESEMADLGVESLRGGHRVDARGDADDIALGAEVADERQRVHAVPEDARTEVDRNVPGAFGGRRLGCRWRGRRRKGTMRGDAISVPHRRHWSPIVRFRRRFR